MRGKIILDRRKVKVPEITICLVDLKKSKRISVNKRRERARTSVCEMRVVMWYVFLKNIIRFLEIFL